MSEVGWQVEKALDPIMRWALRQRGTTPEAVTIDQVSRVCDLAGISVVTWGKGFEERARARRTAEGAR